MSYNKDLIEKLRAHKKEYLLGEETTKSNISYYYELSSEYKSFFNKHPQLKKRFSKLLFKWGNSFLKIKGNFSIVNEEKLFNQTINFLDYTNDALHYLKKPANPKIRLYSTNLKHLFHH